MMSKVQTTAVGGVDVTYAGKLARWAGVFFLITFITSIPALLLYDPVLNDPNYILGSGADTQVQLGTLLEIFLAIANIGTAVTLFPILKRQSEGVALGYVALRVVESTIIVLGLISLLAVITMRQDRAGATGADADAIVNIGRSLVAFHDGTFLLGPAFCAPFGNGLLLGYLMFRSGLVPRRMALLGLVGGPLAFASATAVLFGAYAQLSGWSILFTFPEIVWELSLGIWLAVKGIKASAIVLTPTRPDPTGLLATHPA